MYLTKRNNLLCIIPARAGSRGIPHKNMRLVDGLPLVAWSIRMALVDGIPSHSIVVSSNDDDVLKVAKEFGVTAHRRPEELCGDKSPSELALLDALSNNPNCDAVLMLQPTSPIRVLGRIADAVKTFYEGEYDSLISTTKLYNFMWRKTDVWTPTYDPQHRPMREDLSASELLYFDNGNIYITRRTLLEQTKCRVGGNTCVYPISGAEGLQVDTWEDLEVIRRLTEGRIHCMSVEDLKHETM